MVRARVKGRWEAIDHDTRVLLLQVVRYGISGVIITLFQIAVYNLLSGPAHIAPLVANTIASVLAASCGYLLHSHFSFAGHGERGSVARTGGRFLVVTLIGYAINSLWVWICTGWLRWPDWTPSLPMFFVTPFFLFWLNRRWVFE